MITTKCLVLFIFGVVGALNINIPHAPLSKINTCKSFTAIGSTGYKEMFPIKEANLKKLDPDELVHLRFYLIGRSDALLLLSETNSTKNQLYEIVIQGYGNTKTTIRRKMGGPNLAETTAHPGLLTEFDAFPLDVVQTKYGKISLYVPGYKEGPILSYVDSTPLDINYFSFSGNLQYNVRWYYNCLEDHVRPLPKL